MTQDVIKKIEGIKIIPVVVLHDETKAAPLADALCRGCLLYTSRCVKRQAWDLTLMWDTCTPNVREGYLYH